MLVLTRKTGQSIMIGDDIEVTVLSNDGSKVRLGIRAPATVQVHRVEIYDEIQANHRSGAGAERSAERSSAERSDSSRARSG